MDWMYKGPGQSATDKEDYLLGKAVDKTFEESHRLGGAIADATPAPLLRPIPSSSAAGPSSSSSAQVDIGRKVNEDPLVKIKLAEREKLKRARDKFIAHNVGKSKMAVVQRPTEVSSSSGDGDSLDSILAGKLEVFLRSSGMRLHEDDDAERLHVMIKKAFKSVKKDLESESSSESSSEEDRGGKRGKKDEEGRRRKGKESNGAERGRSPPRRSSPGRRRTDRREEEEEETDRREERRDEIRRNDRTERSPRRSPRSKGKTSGNPWSRNRRRSRSPDARSGERNGSPRRRSNSPDDRRRGENPRPPHERRRSPQAPPPRQPPNRRPKLSAEEMERKRQEMVANAQWREDQRRKNVAKLNADEEAEARALAESKGGSDALLAREFRRVTEGGETVESVIKANRKKLQRRGDLLSRD